MLVVRVGDGLDISGRLARLVNALASAMIFSCERYAMYCSWTKVVDDDVSRLDVLRWNVGTRWAADAFFTECFSDACDR